MTTLVTTPPDAVRLAADLRALGFDAHPRDDHLDVAWPGGGPVALRLEGLDGPEGPLELALRALLPPFESLPFLTEGESKVVRQWTPGVVVMKLKPTVYSYSQNRYGVVEGTDRVRARFAAALLRGLHQAPPRAGVRLRSAFLAEVERDGTSLLVQRHAAACNLEVRVKRYHVGSPVHRYLYTDRHPTTQAAGPLRPWTRLESPVVCFDWRHPLEDERGTRLADEPISDDYAAVWMRNVPHAKELARQTFLWMEERFAAAGVTLVDICFFIDRDGQLIYGEVSPDCMRTRMGTGDPATAPAGDKDVWRQGGSPEALLARYQELYDRIFASQKVDHA